MDTNASPSWRPDLRRARRPLYLAIVDQLAEDIRQRRLVAGQRLPTHRELARQLQMDVTTVSRAYAAARRRGLIAGHVGRGTFVRGHALRERAGLTGAIDLTTNVPPEEDSVVRRTVAKAFDDFSRNDALRAPSGYAPIGGSVDERATAAEWLAHHGMSVQSDRVLVAACAQQAFVAILSAHCAPGDVILTERVTYPGFAAAARLLRLDVMGVDSDRGGLDPASVERLCRRHRPKMLVLVPTLQNPTGVTLSNGRRTKLAAVARRHGLLILEDDAYGPLHDKAPRPIADIAPDVTYLVATASKVLMPMMRWCAIAAPSAALASRVESALRATGWMQSALEGALARRILSSAAAGSILAARRREAAKRRDIAARILDRSSSTHTAGGHHVWLELPRRWRVADFVESCRRRGVLVSSGAEFAIDSSDTPNAVRVCLGAAASHEELETALRIIADVLQGDATLEPPSH